MDDYDLELLLDNEVSQASRTPYRGSSVRLILWIYSNENSLINPQFLDLLDACENEKQQKLVIKNNFISDSKIEPIMFELITPDTFMRWVLSLRKKNGEKVFFTYYIILYFIFITQIN